MKKTVYIFALIFITLSGVSYSQIRSYYSDSLKGFDETAAFKSAISEQFYGDELKVRMFRLKRAYIDNKYGFTNQKNDYTRVTTYLSANKSAAIFSCLNEDFEASLAATVTVSNQINGWVITAGYNGFVSATNTTSLITYFPGGLQNPNSCNLAGCCPMPPTASALIDCSAPGGYVDNTIGPQYPIYSVFGTGTVSGASAANPHISTGLFGTKVLRLNNSINGDYGIERISKTFSVTASNALFQFAYISVFSPGHTCCDAGSLQISLNNATTNSLISCANFSISAPSSACTNSISISYLNTFSGTTYSPNINFGNIYNPWKIHLVNLSAYIGQTIGLDVLVSDCTAGGHFGYIYFDAQCSPMNLQINENEYSLTDPSISYTTCASQFTLTAPAGLEPYYWSGPSGFTATTSIITTTTSGVYTLTLGQSVFCSAITKTINVGSLAGLASISSSSSFLCSGNSAILTANSMNNCLWNTGNTTPSIFISPTVTTTYSVSGTNTDGCPVTAVLTQTVNDCTSLSALKNVIEGISIYPNPNTGEFVINIEKPGISAEFIVENALGQMVQSQKVVSGKNSVKTKGLSPGIYYYSLNDRVHTTSKGKIKIE